MEFVVVCTDSIAVPWSFTLPVSVTVASQGNSFTCYFACSGFFVASSLLTLVTNVICKTACRVFTSSSFRLRWDALVFVANQEVSREFKTRFFGIRAVLIGQTRSSNCRNE